MKDWIPTEATVQLSTPRHCNKCRILIFPGRLARQLVLMADEKFDEIRAVVYLCERCP